jgi:hypothetical protein
MLLSLIAPQGGLCFKCKGGPMGRSERGVPFHQIGKRVYPLIYGKTVNFPLDFEELKEPIIQPYAGYHIREGEHDLTLEDWKIFMDFVEVEFWEKVSF